jgi:cytidylate kinase
VRSPDARVIDTTDLTVDDVVQTMLSEIRRALP